jgi:hypothetical protein
VHLHASGAVKGDLDTAPPPGNLRVQCTVLPKPTQAWVAHVYGFLDGTWLIVVQTTPYSAPGRYTATVSLGRLSPGGTSVSPANDYVGEGSVVVGAGEISAHLTADVKTRGTSPATVHVDGTLSCANLTKQD